MTITQGENRLSIQNEGGYFRGLVWSSEQGGAWHCRAVITQSEFQRGSDKQRWVSSLYSFDLATGHTIIKVGENEVPFAEGVPGKVVRCIYSWREWDLLTNREIRLLRICEDPSEPYDPTRPVKCEDDCLVVIDCKHEDWDGKLCTSLYNRRMIELRNLHSSYEKYLEQLAELNDMEFVPHFSENRGEFKPK